MIGRQSLKNGAKAIDRRARTPNIHATYHRCDNGIPISASSTVLLTAVSVLQLLNTVVAMAMMRLKMSDKRKSLFGGAVVSLLLMFLHDWI